MSNQVLRRQNLLRLFADFVQPRQAAAPGITLQGLDREFAQQLELSNSYFSRLKAGGRPISDKLARQIESHCGKTKGWMDLAHDAPAAPSARGLAKFRALAESAFLAADATKRRELSEMLQRVIDEAK